METEGHIWTYESAEPSCEQIGEIVRAISDLKQVFGMVAQDGDRNDLVPASLRPMLQKLLHAR